MLDVDDSFDLGGLVGAGTHASSGEVRLGTGEVQDFATRTLQRTDGSEQLFAYTWLNYGKFKHD